MNPAPSVYKYGVYGVCPSPIFSLDLLIGYCFVVFIVNTCILTESVLSLLGYTSKPDLPSKKPADEVKMSSMTPISYSFNHCPINNNNSNSNIIVPDHTNHQQTSEAEPSCEFTNPCTTTSYSPTKSSSSQSTGKHPRKVISHIFGRNKFVTKLIPASVWVHYCRKHYQRARYRSTQWPFTQAELLLDSLGRMERWGGVRGFELVLRRREVERVDQGYGQGESGHAVARNSARVSAAKGQGQAGDNGDNGDNEEDTVSASASSNDHDHDQPSSDEHTNTKSKENGKSKGRRKKPNIEPAPVPNWLRQEVGPNKSFENVRSIISRLLEYLTVLRDEGRKEEIRFPDIEILPELEGWVLEMEGERAKRARAAAGGRKGRKRVGGRGAVKKV